MSASLSFWQKIESLLFPVSIRKGSSALNPVLELFYFQGRYILGTTDAVYSDGTKYRPLVKAFETPQLKAALPGLQSILVLGTGLASAVHILSAKGFHPSFTLVEIDSFVLQWAEEFLPAGARRNVQTFHQDAFQFIAECTSSYDLIIVDIFFGRDVPAEVTASPFLAQCKKRLQSDGFLILNYMESKERPEGQARLALQALFSNVAEINFGINKVYVASQPTA
jgi:spermidine synthase